MVKENKQVDEKSKMFGNVGLKKGEKGKKWWSGEIEKHHCRLWYL